MKHKLAPWLFLSCSLLVAAWIVLAHRSSQPFKPFTLTAADFASFAPRVNGWNLTSLPISSIDPAEPNIVLLSATRTPPGPTGLSSRTAALIRLVHGYNMPMCMKIKGFTVSPLTDITRPTGIPGAPAVRIQAWRLTSSTGETSVWLTSMIRAGDFSPTTGNICDMAFPRIDMPDDPRWVPSGFTRADLRHPITAARRWFRARWNSSRTDLLTFLRLKQPAWASDEQLSYITIGKPSSAPDTDHTLKELHDLHIAVLDAFQAWAKTRLL